MKPDPASISTSGGLPEHSLPQGIPRRSAIYSHFPQKALGIHVFPRIPTYSHVFPFWYSQGLYIDLKKPKFFVDPLN